MSDLSRNDAFLRMAFKGYDVNGDGKVSVAEFKRIMLRSGKSTHAEIEKMLKKADVDNDGTITFDEFKKIMGE